MLLSCTLVASDTLEASDTLVASTSCCSVIVAAPSRRPGNLSPSYEDADLHENSDVDDDAVDDNDHYYDGDPNSFH